MQTTQELLTTIGNNIRIFRKAKNWSQADLAIKVGMHKSYIGAIENGKKNISLIKLAQFARVFEISLEQLVIKSIY